MFKAGQRVFVAQSGQAATFVNSPDADSLVIRLDSTEEEVALPRSYVLTVEDRIRQIQRDPSLDGKRKAMAIQEAHRTRPPPSGGGLLRQADAGDASPTLSASSVPACSHYVSQCVIIAACCGVPFQCRLCHDEHTQDHKIDRFATREILCKACDTRQPVSNACAHCPVDASSGEATPFASYFCGVCKLWKEDDDRGTFHCEGCGICRVGKREDYEHCAPCGMCLPRDGFDSHACREDKYRGDCSVCRQDLFSSREPVQTLSKCGHPLHGSCLRALTRSAFAAGTFALCPLCKSSVEDYSALWTEMREAVSQNPMPPTSETGAPESVRVLCHDCGHTTPRAPFHFIGLCCGACLGFNTAQMSAAAAPPPPPPPAAAAAAAATAGGGAGGGGGGEDGVILDQTSEADDEEEEEAEEED